MITYIRKDLPKIYAEFPEEIDAEYWNGQIGTTLSDYYAGKWVKLSDEQVQFREENPTASVQEVFNMLFNVPTIEELRQMKIDDILNYDNSNDINSFYFGGYSAWLTPQERSNYRTSIESAELLGLSNVTLYVLDTEVTLSILQAKQLLAQIQLYADNCYLVTKHHIQNIKNLTTLLEIDEYDYTTDYPEKIYITL